MMCVVETRKQANDEPDQENRRLPETSIGRIAWLSGATIPPNVLSTACHTQGVDVVGHEEQGAAI